MMQEKIDRILRLDEGKPDHSVCSKSLHGTITSQLPNTLTAHEWECWYAERGIPYYKQAVYWYTKGAEQGFAASQYNLGVLYYLGEGVPQDYKQAVYWYTKAAEQGFAAAQFNLELSYSLGDGEDRDSLAFSN
jgi:TPR repeat protein